MLQVRSNSGTVGHLRRWGQIEPRNVTAPVEIAAVDQQLPLAVIDPRAGPRRRHEPAQQRRHGLGVDREIERRDDVLAKPHRFAGLHLQQLVLVDADRVGVDRRGGGDGPGDDLALHQQALDPGLDQPLRGNWLR